MSGFALAKQSENLAISTRCKHQGCPLVGVSTGGLAGGEYSHSRESASGLNAIHKGGFIASLNAKLLGYTFVLYHATIRYIQRPRKPSGVVLLDFSVLLGCAESSKSHPYEQTSNINRK